MVQIEGRPVLFRQIDLLKQQGITDIIVVGGHLGQALRDAVAKEYGPSVQVPIESEPLGTGGALSLAPPQDDAPSLVISGDLLFEMDLAKLLAFHRQHRADVTLTAHPNSHPRDADLLKLEPGSPRVEAILLRPHPADLRYANIVNASIAVVSPSVWSVIKAGQKANFEKDIVGTILKKGGRVFAYRSSEYIKDIGTPDRLQRAELDLRSGLVQARSLRNPQRAIFFEKSLFDQHPGKSLAETLQDNSMVAAVSLANTSPYLSIALVAPDQHLEVETALGDQGVRFDDLLLSQEIDAVKELQERYNLDLAKSFLISNRGEALPFAGINATQCGPTLYDAVKRILNG